MYKDIMAGHVVMKMVVWFLLHQISKIIIIILNMECFDCIIGSRQKIIRIYFLMNGNIFNYSLASEPYSGSCGWLCSHTAYAIPPAPPGNISTITGEPIFVQSYINAYNTAFNQEVSGFTSNYQVALYNYQPFTPNDTNSNFIPGTFGYQEEYNNGNNGETFRVEYLIDNINNYYF